MKQHNKVIGTPIHHRSPDGRVRSANGGPSQLSAVDPNRGLRASKLPREDDGKGKTAEAALKDKLRRGGPQK